LSIYPAERPQSVAEMRARLDIAPPVAGGLVTPRWTAASDLNDSPPSPLPTPAHEAQDHDAAAAFAADSGPLATAGVARIDHDPSAPAAFARQMPSRYIALWSGALVLALLLAGMYEFRPDRQIGRVLDVLGISRDTSAGDSASPSSVGPAAPVPPPIAEDAGSVKSMPTEPAAADPRASATASASPESAQRTPSAEDTAGPAEPAEVAQSPARSSPPTRVAQRNASRAPASPRAVCGARTDFALYRCMQLECSQRQWASHPQCERLRTNDSVD
jgi:non-specific serine/threonine protein kinase